MIFKIFERAVNSQIVEFFDSHFHTSLSAFRKGYGCQTALLKVIEDWKKALDQNRYVAAIFMDLLKAFDCLPHDLLILKLKTYGVSPSALNLRDRPFNLQGGGGGDYVFLFRSEIFFWRTRELEYYFFCGAKRIFFFQNLTL